MKPNMEIYSITAKLNDTSIEFQIKSFQIQDNTICYEYTDNLNLVRIKKSDLMIPRDKSSIHDVRSDVYFIIHCKKGFINEAKNAIINHIDLCLSNLEIVLKAKKRALKNTVTNYKN